MADKTINVRIQQKYDTEANWKAKDPVLLKGEQVFTSDGTNANKYKVGNGTAKWSALPYAKADLSKGDVTTALGYTPPTSNTWRGIQNNLTSGSTTDSLSAAQGKVLKGLVDGKAASSHTHTKSQITDFPTSLPASDVYGWAKASSKPSYTKSEVGLGNVDNTADANKSVKYAGSSGSSNTVVYTALTNTDLNTLQTEGRWYYAGGGNTCTNIPVASAAFELYVGRNASGWRYQQFTVTSGEIYIRVFDSSNWGSWRKLAFTSDTVTAASSVPWSGITGKPSTFAPSSHTHSMVNITDWGSYIYDAHTSRTANTVLAAPNGSNGPASFRKLVAADIPSITKGKITDFPTSLPASDVYAWAKASSKPSYSWSEIGSKPSTFTPSSHTHNYLAIYGSRPADINFKTSTNGAGAMFHFVSTSSTKTGKPPEDSNVLQMNWDNNGGWDTQFAISNGSSPHSYIRSQNNGTWGNWTTLLDSSNYNNYSPSKTGGGASGTWGINITGASGSCTGNAATASKVNGHTVNSDVPSGAKFTDTNTWRPLGTTADTACAGNDSRLSNSRPASDVYSWAKASSKPSYSWSEITSKPSTFTPASHTHSYIPLSGGTITGSIIRSSGGSWISARNNVAVRGTATGKDSWNPVVGQATPNGYWTIGNLASNDNLAFSYTSNTNYNAGNNSATTVYLPVQEGTIITSATIGSQSVKYATSATTATKLNNVTANWDGQITTTSWFAAFNPSTAGELRAISIANVKSVLGISNVNNTADANKSVKYATSAGSAESVAWGNISGKPSSYTPASHTHNYAGSSSAGGNANWANGATYSNYAIKLQKNPTENKSNDGVYFFQTSNDSTKMPDTGWWSLIRTQHPGYTNGYWQEVAYSFSSDTVKFRRNVNGTKSGWKTFAWSDHTHSYLPLSGGALTGGIQMNNNGISIDTNGAMIYGSNTSGNIYFRYKKASSDKDYSYTNLHSMVTAINGKLSLTGGTLNNGSTQCPLIITGSANNESSITFKYKTQTSGGHWVIGEGCGTADLNTFGFYQNGKGVLAKLKNDGQWICNTLDLSGYNNETSLVPGPGDGGIKFSGGNVAWGIVKRPNSLYFVSNKSLKFRMQDTYCYCDVGFQSQGIFDTTTSGAANMRIENDIVKRVSSASKYKLDIQNINEDSSYCYNLLKLNPRQWFDKGEVERYSEYLTAEYNNEDISEEFKHTVNSGSLNPYYGLVAEDLEAAGLEKFCDYGAEKDDGTKELEGIQYDRVPILMIPILRDLVTCMQKILPSVEEHISDATLLSEIKEIESRFNSFNSQNIVNKQYAN